MRGDGLGRLMHAICYHAALYIPQAVSVSVEAVVTVPPPAGGAGGVVGRKRKRRRDEEMAGPAFARRPLSEMYKPVQFFDFEEDDETVVLLTI
jgi:hypothetical protein